MHRLWFLGAILVSCTRSDGAEKAPASSPGCTYVEGDYGPAGTVPVVAETIADGLEVPWGIGFLPNGDFLVTERPGRIRLVANGRLASDPVAVVPIQAQSEGGLLGIAIDPAFAQSRAFYVYFTSGGTNRIARYLLEGNAARMDRIVFDGIPAAQFHDGGRMHFGPDGMLYVGTGDGREPSRSRDPRSPSGKILRIGRDGEIPADNPIAGNPMWIRGVRNVQGFDWIDGEHVVLADHGPSGELGRSGNDELDVATRGDDLGWPEVWRCDTSAGVVTPKMVWQKGLPPGGAIVARGDAIPEWKNDVIVTSLGAQLLVRVVLGAERVEHHEIYFRGTYGRLREIVNAPDGSIFVTTSNCDGRGTCPATRDRILRLRRAR